MMASSRALWCKHINSAISQMTNLISCCQWWNDIYICSSCLPWGWPCCSSVIQCWWTNLKWWVCVCVGELCKQFKWERESASQRNLCKLTCQTFTSKSVYPKYYKSFVIHQLLGNRKFCVFCKSYNLVAHLLPKKLDSVWSFCNYL